MKPTSKIIQIAKVDTQEGEFFGIVLCEDGSVWQKTKKYDWECILEASINIDQY